MDCIFDVFVFIVCCQIFVYFNGGELSVGELGECFDFSKLVLFSYLCIFEDVGLIECEKWGQFVYFCQVFDWLVNILFVWVVEVCLVGGLLQCESCVCVWCRIFIG